jgi:hypothetical protein
MRSAQDLPSADVAAVLDAASRATVAVLAGSAARSHVGATHGAPTLTPIVPGGDITTSGCAVTAADTAIGDWLARRRSGGAAVLVADAEEVRALNERARVALRGAGLLGVLEVGGFARGDVLRFERARPACGIGRHTRAEVVAVDPARGRLDVRLDDGRRVALAPSDLRSVVHAHVVPAQPLLVSGRGDVFVVGGAAIAARHLGVNRLHRYVTVSVPDQSHHLAAARRLDRGVGLSR